MRLQSALRDCRTCQRVLSSTWWQKLWCFDERSLLILWKIQNKIKLTQSVRRGMYHGMNKDQDQDKTKNARFQSLLINPTGGTQNGYKVGTHDTNNLSLNQGSRSILQKHKLDKGSWEGSKLTLSACIIGWTRIDESKLVVLVGIMLNIIIVLKVIMMERYTLLSLWARFFDW